MPEPLRVLFVVPTLRFGGAERLVACLCKAAPPSNVIPGIATLYPSAPLADGLEVAVFLGPGGKFRMLSRLRHLWTAVRQFMPDVVFSVLDQTGPFVWLGRRVARSSSTWVSSIHSSVRWRAPSPRHWFLDRIVRPFNLRASKLTTCCSEKIANDVRQQFPALARKVVTLHNAIDPEPFLTVGSREECRAALGLPVAGRIVLCVGRLVTYLKGQDILIRTMAGVLQTHWDAKLYVVGTGPDRGRLEDLAVDTGVAHAVEFAGESSDIPLWMGAADLFVLPSRAEAFGIVLAEAGCAARAVVATRVDGIPEVVIDGKTGVLVAPDSPHALSQAINGLLASPARARVLGDAGRRHVMASFTPEAWWAGFRRLLSAQRLGADT